MTGPSTIGPGSCTWVHIIVIYIYCILRNTVHKIRIQDFFCSRGRTEKSETEKVIISLIKLKLNCQCYIKINWFCRLNAIAFTNIVTHCKKLLVWWVIFGIRHKRESIKGQELCGLWECLPLGLQELLELLHVPVSFSLENNTSTLTATFYWQKSELNALGRQLRPCNCLMYFWTSIYMYFISCTSYC